MNRDDKDKKKSAARRRAEQHTTGFETTVLRVPEGVSFFDFKTGVHRLEILPYRVKRGKDTQGGNPFAEEGELFFERTFYIWRKIGADEKSYACLSKTFGKPDPIAEFKQQESRRELNADEAKYVKSLKPQERQIFLVVDREHLDKGIQILESSTFSFGALLYSRVNNSTEEEGWDLFFFPDADGMTLRITIEEVDGGGFTFNKATAIDFIPRKNPLPEKYVNHGYDLDDMIVETPYEKLKAIFDGVNTSDDSKKSGKSKDPDDDFPADDPPAKKKEETKKEDKKSDVRVYQKGDKVRYEGKEYSVFKMNTETGMVTLMDKDDEPCKVDAAALTLIVNEDKPKEEKKEEKKSKKTASELGITKEAYVTYKGGKCQIFRIAENGLSVMLMDSNDDVIKDIDPSDLTLIKEEKKEKAQDKPKEEKKEEKKSGGDDDDWDEDWDK